MDQAGRLPLTAQSLACRFAAFGAPWGALGPAAGLPGFATLKTVPIKHN